jgi:hypothetical protein
MLDYSISMNSNSSKASRIALRVTISGLRSNATFGLTAESGTTLSANVVHETDPNPQVTYQWCTQNGPITGANSPDFTVDAALYDEHVLHCQVTPQDAEMGSMVASANYTVRHAPPELILPLDDMIFDLASGTQQVELSGVFAGADIGYTATPAPAAYNSDLGTLQIETDSAIIGSEITLTAFNSGGAASTTFQITVEDSQVEDMTYYIPALTPQGGGEVPVSGTAILGGDASGHWQIIDQMLSPSAAGDLADLDQTPYTLVLDDGQSVTIEITQQIGTNQWALSGPRADGFDLVVFDVPQSVTGLQISLNGSPFTDLGGNTPGTYFIGGLEPETAYRVALRGFASAGGPPSLKSIFTVPTDPRGFRGWNAEINLGTGGDLFVAPYGNDANDGLSPTTPFKTVNAANSAATSGDVIKIRAGLYRELIEPKTDLSLEGFGTEKPILTAAEPLAGFVRCDGSDASLLGAAYFDAGGGPCPIYKTTLNKVEIEHGEVLALNIFDGGERMFPATDRADTSDLFNDLDQKSYHKASAIGVNPDDLVVSITDPNILTSARYTEDQLLAADVLLYHFPNVVSRVKITSVDLAQNTIYVDGLKRLQTSGNDVDTYALTNVGPAMTRGTYYIEEHDTDIDIYIYPLNANQIDLIDYSSRSSVIKLSPSADNISLRGLHVTRASGSDTAGGINIFKSDVNSLSGGHVIEHVLSTDVYNSERKARSIRLNRTQNTGIKNCSFYNLMNGIGIFLSGGSMVKDGDGVVIERTPGINNLVSHCHFEKIAGSGALFFHQFQIVIAHNYITGAGTAAHSNKTVTYEQCHNVLWWGNEFADDVRGYLTWQEASAITVAWNVLPIFSYDQSDRRAIVDQTNATPAPEPTSPGHIFNNAVRPQIGSNANGVAVFLSNERNLQPLTVVNNIFDSVTAPARAVPPYTQFTSNLVMHLGYDGAIQSVAEFPEGNIVQTDLAAIYTDTANGDFSPAIDSPILSIAGQDITDIVTDLQTTYPFFNGFDRDYKDQLIDYAMLPVGPDATLPFLRIPQLSNVQTSATSANSATGAVTTSLSGGTLYAGLWSDTLSPDDADIIAGTGAVFHEIAPDPTAGAQALIAENLPSNQILIWHFLHVRPQGQASLSSAPLTLSQGPSGLNLMPDPNFDNPSKWSLAPGYDMSAGTLVVGAAAANFTSAATDKDHSILVNEATTYDISFDVVSVTVDTRLRILVQELNAGASLSSIVSYDTNTAGALVAGKRVNFQITTQASVDALKLTFNKVGSLEAVFDNISCIEIS